MSSINSDEWLAPISEASPCGIDASYDADYLALERLAQGTPEQQVGEHVIPASDPDWGDVKDICLRLFKKTRDLRVTLHLALALLKTEGAPGFRDGVALLRGLLEHYWDTVYPELDPTETNPALERVNVVSSLSPRSEGYLDPMRFRQRLMETPLTQSARMGRFGLRDMMIAEGELKPSATDDGKAPPDRATVLAAIADTPSDSLADIRQALMEACGHIEAVGRIFDEHVGVGQGPDLDGTISCLKQMLKRIASDAAPSDADTTTDMTPAPNAGTGAASAPASGVPQAVSGSIESQQDILSALDRICRYYERTEPSSPVPILLSRARRLVGKSYVDIARDLTPDAMKQIEALGGLKIQGASGKE